MTSVFTNCVFRKEINLVSLYQATELYCREDIKPIILRLNSHYPVGSER